MFYFLGPTNPFYFELQFLWNHHLILFIMWGHLNSKSGTNFYSKCFNFWETKRKLQGGIYNYFHWTQICCGSDLLFNQLNVGLLRVFIMFSSNFIFLPICLHEKKPWNKEFPCVWWFFSSTSPFFASPFHIKSQAICVSCSWGKAWLFNTLCYQS